MAERVQEMADYLVREGHVVDGAQARDAAARLVAALAELRREQAWTPESQAR